MVNYNLTKNSNEILNSAFTKAIGGGLSGSCAMIIQITTLMWLRTTMNYQYRYGGNTFFTLKKLYNEGGIFRFYRGYPFALMIAPLARFGDIASNTYITNYFKNNNNIPLPVQTLISSSIASSWRIFLMPLDTFKTSLQVEGNNGIKLLKNKINNNGYRVLYNGSLASLSATFVGNYPWFLTYNFLNNYLPKYQITNNINSNKNNIKENLYNNFIRYAIIGFSSSVISDTCSNSLRVIKTSKQTYNNNLSYTQITKDIIKKDGLIGLFGRGLKTRILTNGLQGIIFTVSWKFIEKYYF